MPSRTLQGEEAILTIRISSVSKVTSVTLTTKKYCATVTISISTGRHNEVIETTGTLLGRTRQKE